MKTIAENPHKLPLFKFVSLSIILFLLFRSGIFGMIWANLGNVFLNRTLSGYSHFDLASTNLPKLELTINHKELNKAELYLRVAEQQRADVCLPLIKILLIQNQIAQAKDKLQTCELKPVLAKASLIVQADIAELSGDYEEAVTLYSQLNTLPWQKAINAGEKAIHLENWGDALIQYQLALIELSVMEFRQSIITRYEYVITNAIDSGYLQFQNPAHSDYLVARYTLRNGNINHGRELLQEIYDSPKLEMLENEYAADVSYQIGLALMEDHKLDDALSAFSEALELDPQHIEAYAHVLEIVNNHNHESPFPLEPPSLKPEYTLLQSNYSADWKMVGYDLHELDLELGTPIFTRVYWECHSCIVNEVDDSFYKIQDDIWVQILYVNNLIPNAGFEWGIDYQKIYTNRMGGNYESNYRIIDSQRNNTMTNVLALYNQEIYRIQLLSKDIYVDDKRYYLQAGWIKTTETTRGILGREWFGDTTLPSQPNNDNWIGGYVTNPNWIYITTYFTPWEGATRTKIWLFSRSDDNNAEFLSDNLLLVQIDPPFSREATQTE